MYLVFGRDELMVARTEIPCRVVATCKKLGKKNQILRVIILPCSAWSINYETRLSIHGGVMIITLCLRICICHRTERKRNIGNGLFRIVFFFCTSFFFLSFYFGRSLGVARVYVWSQSAKNPLPRILAKSSLMCLPKNNIPLDVYLLHVRTIKVFGMLLHVLACNGRFKLAVRFKYFTAKFSESVPINFKRGRQN
jgi:hypothetical protein